MPAMAGRMGYGASSGVSAGHAMVSRTSVLTFSGVSTRSSMVSSASRSIWGPLIRCEPEMRPTAPLPPHPRARVATPEYWKILSRTGRARRVGVLMPEREMPSIEDAALRRTAVGATSTQEPR